MDGSYLKNTRHVTLKTLLPLSSADVADLTQLETNCFPDTNMAEEALEAELHYGSGIGVQQDGALIAYTLWRIDEGLMDITRLGVHSSHRRMGLGRLLLRTARITARLPAMLTVKKDNAEALALYRAEGFRVVGDLRTGAWVMRAPAI